MDIEVDFDIVTCGEYLHREKLPTPSGTVQLRNEFSLVCVECARVKELVVRRNVLDSGTSFLVLCKGNPQ